MTRDSVAKTVRERKERHPELYCPVDKCLWFTGGGYCPKHKVDQKEVAAELDRWFSGK